MSTEVTRVLTALHPSVTTDGLCVSGLFEPQPEHRGNPGWLHGGLAATVLDHVCARAASAALGGDRVVTGRLDLRYRAPVALAAGPYQVRAEAQPARGRVVKVKGAILGPNGRPLVTANALFVRLEQGQT